MSQADDEELSTTWARKVLAVPANEGVTDAGLVADGLSIEKWAIVRSHGPIFDAPIACEPTRMVDDPVIFAGWTPSHFGHFLLEGLARIWYLRKWKSAQIVWLARNNRPDYDRSHRALLDVLEIHNPPIFITEPTLFKLMVVPEPGYRIPNYFSVQHARAMGIVVAPDPAPGKRVWLSRSKLDDRGGFANEAEAEAELERNGWLIYHPQEHPLPAQLDMLKDAEQIAGVEGSAFHTLILIDNPRARVSVFTRRGEAVSPNMITIARAKQLDQEEINEPFEYIDEGEGRAKSRVRWTDPLNIARVLERRRA
jgi:capsular polysaccharide biosynthesis protein